jgi:hypothetical protein
MDRLHGTTRVDAGSAGRLAESVDDELPLADLAVLRVTPKEPPEVGMAGHARKRGVHELRDEIVAAQSFIERMGGLRLRLGADGVPFSKSERQSEGNQQEQETGVGSS